MPKDVFIKSKETSASVFFVTVFGAGRADKALNALVLLSAFANLLAVLVGQSRVIREIGRQGVLPFTEFWVSTKPFGTPIGPYFLKWLVTFIMIVAPPAGDAFQFGEPDPSFPILLATSPLNYRVLICRNSCESGDLPAEHISPSSGYWSVSRPLSTQTPRASHSNRIQDLGHRSHLLHPTASVHPGHAVDPSEGRPLRRQRFVLVRYVLRRRYRYNSRMRLILCLLDVPAAAVGRLPNTTGSLKRRRKGNDYPSVGQGTIG